MKVIKHGIYYYKTVKIVCNKCNCIYEIRKEDIKKYSKRKKVKRVGWDDIWTDKYEYYTNCPECCNDNELEYRNYDILTTEIIGGTDENNIS